MTTDTSCQLIQKPENKCKGFELQELYYFTYDVLMHDRINVKKWCEEGPQKLYRIKYLVKVSFGGRICIEPEFVLQDSDFFFGLDSDEDIKIRRLKQTFDIILRSKFRSLSIRKANKAVGFVLLIVLLVPVSHFGKRLHLFPRQ